MYFFSLIACALVSYVRNGFYFRLHLSSCIWLWAIKGNRVMPWICQLVLCIKFGVFKYSLNILFYLFLPSSFPFSPTTTTHMHMLVCLMVSHTSQRLCSLLFILVSLCSYDYITFIDLPSTSLILTSDRSSLLLSPSSQFFILVTVLFDSRISIWIL